MTYPKLSNPAREKKNKINHKNTIKNNHRNQVYIKIELTSVWATTKTVSVHQLSEYCQEYVLPEYQPNKMIYSSIDKCLGCDSSFEH